MRLIAVLCVAASLPAFAAPSLVVNHTGRLLDATDAPIGGSATLKFELHTTTTVNQLDKVVWTDTYDAVVLDKFGVYSVALGDTTTSGGGHTALTADLFTDARWLAITVNGAALSPWLPIGAVPYAVNAGAVGGVTVAAIPTAGALLALDANAKFPASVLPAVTTASGNADGILSQGDWTTFNGKLARVAVGAGLSGDGTAANPLTVSQIGVSATAPLTGTGTNGSPLGIAIGAGAGTVAAGDDSRFGTWTGAATGLSAASARTSLGLGTAATTDASAYATAAQGAKADSAFARTGGALSGALSGTTATFSGDVATAGVLKVGGASATCTGNAGAIRWTGMVFQGCNGTSWGSLTQQPPNSQSNPGTSCLGVLNAGQSVGDGLYWLSYNGGTPAQVACDMTNSGLQTATFTGATFAQSGQRSGYSSGQRDGYVFWIGGGDCCFNSAAAANQWTQVTFARAHRLVKMTGNYPFSNGFYGGGFPVLLQGFDGTSWQTVHTFSADVSGGVAFSNPGYYTVYRMFMAAPTSYWHLYPAVDQFKAMILP